MKTITNFRFKSIAILLLLNCIISYSQVTIKSQGFEGATSDDLLSNSTTNVGPSSTTAMSGSKSLRFTGSGSTSNTNTNAVFYNVSLLSYTNVQVSIAYAATGVDDDEDLFIDFSYDGGTNYVDTFKLIDGNNGGTGQNLAFGIGDALPGQSTNPFIFSVPSSSSQIRVRIRSNNLETSEYFYIDDIVISGTPNPEINLQGGSPTANIVSGSTTISGNSGGINTDFGNTDYNSGSVTKTYTLQNTGTSNLDIYSVYTNSGDFSTTISSTSIVAGGTATLTVVFNPTNAGLRNGIVSISNNDDNESTYNFSVQGTGTEQEINLQGGSPLTNIASGSTLISNSINTNFGTTAGTKTYTIQNLGTSDLFLTSAYCTNSDYAVSYSSGTITSGGSATLTVVFNPITSGTRLGTIYIQNNDTDEGTYTFNVSAEIADKEINIIGNSTTILNNSVTISSTLNTDFGNIQLNSGMVTKTYTIQNTGGITLNIWSTYSDLGDYSVSSSSSTIIAGGTAILTVVYNPTITGTRTGTISISNNDGDESTYSFKVAANCSDREINVTGNSTTIIDGNTAISTTDFTNFGSSDVVTGTVIRTYTIENSGSTPLTISNPTLSGTNSGDFSVTTNPATLTIAAGSSTTFSITFNPASINLRNAVLTIANNDSDESPYNFAIQGSGTNREINLRGNGNNINDNTTGVSVGNNTNFGSMDINVGTIVKTFTIENIGSTVLTISNPTISGAEAGDFEITSNPGTLSIAAGSNTTFSVTFNPSAINARNATINIINDDSTEDPYNFAIQGTGTNREINLIGNSNNIPDGSTTILLTNFTDFGSMDITTGTITRTYTIQNLGTTALGVTNPIIVSGTNATDFTVTTNPNSSTNGGSSTNFVVTFNPSAIGTRSAIISINNNDSDESIYDFAVEGTGTDREINLQGNSNDIVDESTTIALTNFTEYGFADIGVGTVVRTYTIQNTGSTELTISNPTISGTAAADFTVTSAPSTLSIAAGSSTTFEITFNPSVTNTRNATVTIANNDSNENSYNFAIQGTGTSVEINLQGNSNTIADGSVTITSTNATEFGGMDVTLGSISRTYTIQNTGTAILTISNPTISGTNASDFTITTNPSTLSIAGGASTTFTVTFDPSALNIRTASIEIINNDNNENPYNFEIQGSGIIDLDADGIDNGFDNDDDNDGITDLIECSTCQSDPFVNGSFENPVIANSSYAILPTTSLQGWQTSAENFIEIWSSGFLGVPSASGNQFAELNANLPGTLYQTFCLNGAGGTINWSIKHRGRAGFDQAFVKFGSTLANAIASSPIVEMIDGNTAWGTYTGIYNIPVGQTQIVLTFQAGYTDSGAGSQSVGNFIDDVQMNINQNNCADTDGDGIPNVRDLDSDNDGIPDIEEAGFKIFSSNTSTMDKTSSSTWIDANNNGMNDYIDTLISAGTYINPNFDGDIVTNYVDLDSDNDSLFDVDESGLFNGDGDINGDGKGDGIDTDVDGLLNLYDNSSNFGTTTRIYAQDTDTNGVANYLQLDSNNDGVKDVQSGLFANLDVNNDGKIDGTTDADRDGILDAFDSNTNFYGSPRDLNRKLLLDFDGRNDYAENISLLGGLEKVTLMAWIDLNSGYSSEGVVVGQNNFQIRITNDRKLEAVANGVTITDILALNTSQWYHVAAVYSANSLKLYLNGKLIGTQSTSGSLPVDATKLTIGKNPAGTDKYFKGKIDEVRVFDAALTDVQVQRMVYQEISTTSSELRGTIVPKDILGLQFTNLLRYYRMDTYKDDIVDDLTTTSFDLVTGMKMYNHKNIYVQQAPMPFKTERTGTFATAVNSPTNDIKGLDVLEQDYSIIQVKHAITETANITSLGMFVDAGITVLMNNDTKIQNNWYLKLDGKIDLIGKSQLVQTAESDLDAASSGFIERDQQGHTNRFNYNYWCSPVGAINATTNNNTYTVANVMRDGTDADNLRTLLWTPGLNSTTTESAVTLSSYWIFKFQNLSNIYANWASVGQNGILQASQGFTLKGSNAATPTQNLTFVGKPNNGVINSTVAANFSNLSGNPYPSSLDSNLFIKANGPTGSNSISGTLYFWEHYTTNVSHNTAEYQGGYGTLNLTGGTSHIVPAGISGLGASAKTPGKYIPVGQGFFIRGSATGGVIKFDNSQRSFIKETNINSSTLLRNQDENSVETNNQEDVVLDTNFKKIRLGFTTFNNYHREVLLGFMEENATPAIDYGYDGKHIDNQPNDMYFLLAGTKLNIQGTGYFNETDIYPLGVIIGTAGNVKFSLNSTENFDENQGAFIYDNVTNLYHNIKEEEFVIELPIGTHSNRFSLRFMSETSLGTDENILNNGIIIVHAANNEMISIKNNIVDTTIKSVTLINMLGQNISTWDVESQDQQNIQLFIKNVTKGTYIVKATTETGEISKKIIIQ